MNYRPVLRIALSIILTVSVLTPTVVSLTDVSSDKIAFFDSGDEENNKETEKKFDEKELFFENYGLQEGLTYSRKGNLEKSYLLRLQKIDSEILLPPPQVFQ